VRVSTGQILQRPPWPQSSSGFRWLSRSIRRIFPHKTEAGVVRLNLGDAAQVRTAYAEILAGAKAYAPQARITGVSVQEMVGEGVESHHGRQLRPAIGPGALAVSRLVGGVMVEVYNDVALRRCPITRLGSTGYDRRGSKEPGCSRVFAGGQRRTSRRSRTPWCAYRNLAMHLEGHLAELDINPLMVLPSGQGVKAVDALVVFRCT